MMLKPLQNETTRPESRVISYRSFMVKMSGTVKRYAGHSDGRGRPGGCGVVHPERGNQRTPPNTKWFEVFVPPEA